MLNASYDAAYACVYLYVALCACLGKAIIYSMFLCACVCACVCVCLVYVVHVPTLVYVCGCMCVVHLFLENEW